MPTPKNVPSAAPAVPKKSHELVRTGAPDMTATIRAHGMRIIQEDEARMRELLPDSDPVRKSLPEPIFREHFLPIISGEAFKRLAPDYTPQRLADEATSTWARIAGSLGAEVEVVEPDGTVAFIFPALMDTSGLKTQLDWREPGLAPVTQEYLHHRRGMPAVAERVLDRGLSAKLTTLLGRPDDKAAAAKMQKVYDYYGINPTQEEAPKQAEAPSINPGDFSFD